MPLKIIRGDITRVKADAIVNAANSELAQGGGVCGAIFTAAGAENLRLACQEIGSCPVGQAVMTPAFQLPARYIIHTVGPVWQGGRHGEQTLLAGCYRESLQLALVHKLESIAFPLIASGIYQYPKEEALQVATGEICTFLQEHDLLVYLVIYDKASFALSQQKAVSITAYIDDHYVSAHPDSRRRRLQDTRQSVMDVLIVQETNDNLPSPVLMRPEITAHCSRRLDDIVNHLDESFSQMLLRLIDEKGCKDSIIYKRANIDRRHFSKIRSKKTTRRANRPPWHWPSRWN